MFGVFLTFFPNFLYWVISISKLYIKQGKLCSDPLSTLVNDLSWLESGFPTLWSYTTYCHSHTTIIHSVCQAHTYMFNWDKWNNETKGAVYKTNTEWGLSTPNITSNYFFIWQFPLEVMIELKSLCLPYLSTLATPVPVRSLKLSKVWLSYYLTGWPPGAF